MSAAVALSRDASDAVIDDDRLLQDIAQAQASTHQHELHAQLRELDDRLDALDQRFGWLAGSQKALLIEIAQAGGPDL